MTSSETPKLIIPWQSEEGPDRLRRPCRGDGDIKHARLRVDSPPTSPSSPAAPFLAACRSLSSPDEEVALTGSPALPTSDKPSLLALSSLDDLDLDPSLLAGGLLDIASPKTAPPSPLASVLQRNPERFTKLPALYGGRVCGDSRVVERGNLRDKQTSIVLAQPATLFVDESPAPVVRDWRRRVQAEEIKRWVEDELAESFAQMSRIRQAQQEQRSVALRAAAAEATAMERLPLRAPEPRADFVLDLLERVGKL